MRAILLLLGLMAAGVFASGQLYLALPVAGLVAVRFGVSTDAATWMGPSFGLAYAVGFLVWGPASDWFGRRIVLLIGLGAAALATLGVAFAPTFDFALTARVVQGLFAAAIPPAGLALVGEALPPRWRAFGQSLASFSFIASAPLAQLFAEGSGFSLRSLFLIGAAGFGRSSTSVEGVYRFRTIRPGRVDEAQAPHIAVGVFGRGLLKRLATRVYFEDEEVNADDPILALVPAERRDTLIARKTGDVWRFDIVLQGERETVFFDV